MIIKILFWIVICFDVAVLLLFFVLGLAAATSSKTSPLAVAGYMLVIPGLLLAGAVVLFLRSNSAVGRLSALVLAASPALYVGVVSGLETAKVKINSDAQGKLTYFREGPQRDLSLAIEQNDVAKVAALLPQVKVNERGYSEVTPLMLALRQLRSSGGQVSNGKAEGDKFEVLRALLKAGGDPNAVAHELPLEMAIQISSKVGPEPALMLLKAGANPNAKTEFGSPAFFAATGRMASPEILQAVLEHGADLKLPGNQGKNVVHYAALASNWKAVLVLLQRGADWKQVKTLDGRSFLDMLEAQRQNRGEEPGLAEVISFVKAAQ